MSPLSKTSSSPCLSIIIPTYNGGTTLRQLLTMVTQQSIPVHELLIVDSSSQDNTVQIAKEYGAQVTSIAQASFDHGGTRTMMAKKATGDILVFLTQDALPVSEDAVEKLIEPLLEKKADVAYGRQLPRPEANVFAAHLRHFNYPVTSGLRSFEDRQRYGLKTVFISNSFAAYRKQALGQVEYFKNGLIFGEDTCTVGRMLMGGGKVAYVAEAQVYHSHNYSLKEEFKRSFDIGVLHVQEHWLLDTFGKAEGHGLAYVQSEVAAMRNAGKIHLLPLAVLRNFLKYSGYKMGRMHASLPGILVRSMSMNRSWWLGKK